MTFVDEARFHIREGRFAGARGQLEREGESWPVRIDIATPISRKSGEGRFNLYVSIGQAF